MKAERTAWPRRADVLRADVRLTFLLVRGSDRREWWRVALTGVGALLATLCGLGAVTLAAIQGQVSIPYGHGLLDQPGQRAGAVIVLLLLLVPVLGFLGQCARIGAVHRDRRLAGLRLAGATPGQVRRIAASEAGLASLAGAVAAVVLSVAGLLALGHQPWPLAWIGYALLVPGIPLTVGVVTAAALRRVVVSPLGWVRRTRPKYGPRALLTVVVPVVFVALVTGLVPLVVRDHRNAFYLASMLAPVGVIALVLLVGVAALVLSGGVARIVGRRLRTRAKSPAVLIAAGRLEADPWAAARTHAVLVLVALVGTAFMGVREVLLASLRAQENLAEDMAFYTTGIDLTGAGILVALLISLAALAVGTIESLVGRRRGLAAQSAAGVPRGVLARAVLLETALPLAPAILLAGLVGLAVQGWYAGLSGAGAGGHALPVLTPVGIYAACVLATAATLPALHRAVRQAELRFD